MAWVAAIIGVGMSLMQASAQRDASKLTAKMAGMTRQLSKQNEVTIQANNAEEQYRLQKNQTFVYSEAVARAAASGVILDGSSAIYLKDLRDTQTNELEWLKRVGDQQVRQEEINGILGYQSGLGQAAAQKAAAIGSVGQAAAGAYNAYAGYRASTSQPSSITASTSFTGGANDFTTTTDYSLGSNWMTK